MAASDLSPCCCWARHLDSQSPLNARLAPTLQKEPESRPLLVVLLVVVVVV